MNEPNQQPRHIPELDGVRGIAVLAVLGLHFHAPWIVQRRLGIVTDLIARGWAGVDIFFVLSGFLITSILVSTRKASNYFAVFYMRRFLRIVPLAYLLIAVFYWICVPLAHRHHLLLSLPLSEQLWYWAFLGNWRQGLGLNDGAELGHFWSLAIEEQFYVLFSCLAFALSARRLRLVCVGLLIVSMASRLALFAAGYGRQPDTSLWRLTPLHLDALVLGALLACSPTFLHWASRWRWLLMAAGGLGLLLRSPGGLAIFFAAVGSTGLVAMAATRSVHLLRNGLLTRCGVYSYGMYVLHPFWASAILAKRFPASTTLMWVSLLLGPPVSFGIAVVSWNILEKHFLRLKRLCPYRFQRSAEERSVA